MPDSITKEGLREVIDLHHRWLSGDPKGKRANLCGVDLRGVDLARANLQDAKLSIETEDKGDV